MKNCILPSLLLMMFSSAAQAFFYRADTMSTYCKNYLKVAEIDIKIDEYSAGICAGYMASKLEFLQLTDRLCTQTPPDLDDVVRGYIEYVEANPQIQDKSSVRAVVSYLDSRYTCAKEETAQ